MLQSVKNLEKLHFNRHLNATVPLWVFLRGSVNSPLWAEEVVAARHTELLQLHHDPAVARSHTQSSASK